MPIPQLKPKTRFDKSWKDGNSRKKRKKRKQLWDYVTGRILPIFVILVIMAGISLLGLFAWFSRDLPDPDKLIERSIAQSTKIFARDAKTLLYEIHGEYKRTLVNLEDISDYAKWATIAIEDKNFYKHKGFSLPRIIKALWVDILKRQKAQGASTITQQFVKNAILTKEKSWTRKIKEIVLAYQIERKFSKEQILKLYFNEIPYGSNAYGIQAAAQTYFDKNAIDLNIAESALLAALPRATTFYSPYGTHPNELITRQQMIIDLMADQKYITESEAKESKEIDILSKVRPRRENIRAPHFVMYVREILAEKYGNKEVEQGGLKVITTLEYNLQRIAEEEVSKQAEKNKRYRASNAALVALNPITGEILAMVGSKNYFDKDIDGNVNVTLRPRQPGSSFKPVVYATAFKNGYTPKTILFDLVTTFRTDTKNYIPKNYDLEERGPVTMKQALAGSLNIPAVKTLYLAGIDKVLDMADALGYSTLKDRSRFGLSLVLGGGEVKLLEHVSAFSAFANDGERASYYPILRIEDAQGKVLEKFSKNKVSRVIDKEIARLINNILSDNSARAYVFGARNFLNLGSRPIAAKTGTTDDYRDAWTIGYTPELAAGVWVGNNDNSEMRRGAAGAVVAAPIWYNFMKRAVEGAPVKNFKRPKPINTNKAVLNGELEGEIPIKIDKITKKQIPESCLDDWPQDFVEEKIIKEVHNLLHYVQKYDPQGEIPSNPEKDIQYKTWEEAVIKWTQDNNYIGEKPELEDCTFRAKENLPIISITSPADNSTITETSININAEVSGQNTITSVNFYLNDELIKEITSPPYNFTYDVSTLKNGYHTIKAQVTDEAGNISKTTNTINLLINQGISTLYFISPIQNESLEKEDFPFNLKAFAYDPNGVSKITFSYQDSSAQNTTIGTIDHPTSNNVNSSWTYPGDGTFKLFLVMENENAEQSKSDFLTVKIGQ